MYSRSRGRIGTGSSRGEKSRRGVGAHLQRFLCPAEGRGDLRRSGGGGWVGVAYREDEGRDHDVSRVGWPPRDHARGHYARGRDRANLQDAAALGRRDRPARGEGGRLLRAGDRPGAVRGPGTLRRDSGQPLFEGQLRSLQPDAVWLSRGHNCRRGDSEGSYHPHPCQGLESRDTPGDLRAGARAVG